MWIMLKSSFITEKEVLKKIINKTFSSLKTIVVRVSSLELFKVVLIGRSNSTITSVIGLAEIFF